MSELTPAAVMAAIDTGAVQPPTNDQTPPVHPDQQVQKTEKVETPERKVETPRKSEEVKSPKVSDTDKSELQRLHGVVKSKESQNQELRKQLADFKTQQPSARTAVRQPAAKTEVAVSEFADPDEAGELTPDQGKISPEMVAVLNRLEQQDQVIQSLLGKDNQRVLGQAESEEDAAIGEMESYSLATVGKVVGELYPSSLQPDQIEGLNNLVEAMARQEFGRLEAQGLTPLQVLDPENVLKVSVSVYERFKTIGALLAAEQIKTNEESRNNTKGVKTSDAVAAVAAGKKIDQLKPDERDKLYAAIEQRIAGGAG